MKNLSREDRLSAEGPQNNTRFEQFSCKEVLLASLGVQSLPVRAFCQNGFPHPSVPCSHSLVGARHNGGGVQGKDKMQTAASVARNVRYARGVSFAPRQPRRTRLRLTRWVVVLQQRPIHSVAIC